MVVSRGTVETTCSFSSGSVDSALIYWALLDRISRRPTSLFDLFCPLSKFKVWSSYFWRRLLSPPRAEAGLMSSVRQEDEFRLAAVWVSRATSR